MLMSPSRAPPSRVREDSCCWCHRGYRWPPGTAALPSSCSLIPTLPSGEKPCGSSLWRLTEAQRLGAIGSWLWSSEAGTGVTGLISGVGPVTFLLGTPEENRFSGLFWLLKAAAFLPLGPLPPSLRPAITSQVFLTADTDCSAFSSMLFFLFRDLREKACAWMGKE